jgi:hypothetical protein
LPQEKVSTDTEHVQEFARNVEILRKSKEDVDVDTTERKAAASAMQVTFDPDLDDAEDILDETCADQRCD